MSRRRTRKELIKTFTAYGFHLWAIFFLANVLLIYSFNLFIKAAEPPKIEPPKAVVIRQDVGSLPTPTLAPLGPSLDLSFSIPGIGSGGGNMVPKHPKRNITLYLYSRDVNAQDKKIPPLYTIESTAIYDDNPFSPTYTSYINPLVDLGTDVKPGVYQVTFRTEQSFRTLIKDKPDDVGGKLFNITKEGQLDPFGHQTLVMGDIAPLTGNNIMGVDDFNVFLDCYGNKQDTESCLSRIIADLNDDGLVDGIDYNIMVLGFQRLVKQGYPPVTVSVPPVLPSTVSSLSDLTPTVKPKKKTPTPTAAPAPKASGGGAIAGIIFVVFLIVAGAIGFILYKRKKNPAEQPQPAAPAPSASPSAETPAPAVDPNAPKEYFVKKESDDPDGKSVWLTLTGDSGAISGHYNSKEVTEGFASVGGALKTENGKTFLEISEIKPVA